MIQITTSKQFEREAKQLFKKYKSLVFDIISLKEKLVENPTFGTPLGKNCFKIRLAITDKAQGKSGGARTV